MTFDYSGIAATATAQLADKGRDVQIIYATEGTYDPNTDTLSGDSDNTVTTRALVTNFNQRDVSAGLVEAGDKQVIIAAAGITKPKTGDKVLDGEEFRVVTVTEIKPGDTAVLYKLQVRK